METISARKMIGNYVVAEVIGRGAFSRVHRGWLVNAPSEQVCHCASCVVRRRDYSFPPLFLRIHFLVYGNVSGTVVEEGFRV